MRYKTYLESHLSDIVPKYVQLPAGYHIVGHVVLLNIDEQLRPYAELVAKLTLEFEPRIKSVAIKLGPTTGISRTPNYRLIAGDSITTTTHIENGVIFRLDPLRLTFSGGNTEERIKMPLKIKSEEIVIDMFSCVGQFALHIAKHSLASKVIAIEINPVAYEFLLENITLNSLEEKVAPILGDCRLVHLNYEADRVVMGYLHGTIEYLPYALEMLTSQGGMVHMHMIAAKEHLNAIIHEIESKCGVFEFVPEITIRKVKKYAPNIDHFVFDIQLYQE
jgi:tRNA wybutosine-synthesizing protein 2